MTENLSSGHGEPLALLRLMHIADSALPIGSAAHSFGLEALIDSGDLVVADLEPFFVALLDETGWLEAAYCRAAHALGATGLTPDGVAEWVRINARLAALRPARESRTASATLGRRLLRLVGDLAATPLLERAIVAANAAGVATFHCTAFGLVGSALGNDATTTTLIYLHQSLAALISACQRLLPFGQNAAAQLLWHLKPTILAVAQASDVASQDLDAVGGFAPLAELGSLCHPHLRTRLFIS